MIHNHDHIRHQTSDISPSSALEHTLTLRPGSLRDFAALEQHHYRGSRPATAPRVLALEDRRPTVVGRFLGRRGESQVVGVLVESLPALSCSLRDTALRGRYRGLEISMRARLVNQEVRCISRVVIDPRWRGLGLAVRLVRAALGLETCDGDGGPATLYTEALAAMGHVSPFFERAGMTAYRRPPTRADDRLAAALRAAGFSPLDLAMLGATGARIDALPTDRRAWLLAELRRWRRTVARCDDADGGIVPMLKTARRRLLCEPVYYLRRNISDC